MHSYISFKNPYTNPNNINIIIEENNQEAFQLLGII